MKLVDRHVATDVFIGDAAGIVVIDDRKSVFFAELFDNAYGCFQRCAVPLGGDRRRHQNDLCLTVCSFHAGLDDTRIVAGLGFGVGGVVSGRSVGVDAIGQPIVRAEHDENDVGLFGKLDFGKLIVVV